MGGFGAPGGEQIGMGSPVPPDRQTHPHRGGLPADLGSPCTVMSGPFGALSSSGCPQGGGGDYWVEKKKD